MKRVNYFGLFILAFLCLALSSCTSGITPESVLPTAAGLPTFAPTPNIPATATSAPVLIPGVSKKPFPITVRPVPLHEFLFKQNFEDGNVGEWINDSSTPLTVLSEDNNHYLHFVASGDISWPGFWKKDIDPTAWHNYAAESRIRFYDSGVVFAVYVSNYDFYQTGLGYPDFVYFSDYVQNRSESYQQFNSGGFNFKPDQWYKVRIEILGSQLSMYIDDQLVLHAQRDTIPNGSIAFLTGSEHSGTFDVDNIRVWKLN